MAGRPTLLILSARPELEVNRRLEEAATARGARARVVDATRVSVEDGARPHLWLDREDLLEPPPRAVLVRVGNWRPDALLAALEAAQAVGARTTGPASSVRAARDQWRTVSRLAARGLPVPASLAGADPEVLAAATAARLGFPAVVKQRRSRMGVGAIRCLGRDHLEAVLDSLWRVGDELMTQRFVECGGVSLRLLVSGDEVVAAARATACAGEWRSNAARGGRLEPHLPTAAERDLALSAAATLELGVCGVDLLPAADGPLVCEVNPTPGFRHLEAATGIDVAGAIVGHLLG